MLDKLIEETEQNLASLQEDYRKLLEAVEQTKVNLIALNARLLTLRELKNNDAADTHEVKRKDED